MVHSYPCMRYYIVIQITAHDSKMVILCVTVVDMDHTKALQPWEIIQPNLDTIYPTFLWFGNFWE